MVKNKHLNIFKKLLIGLFFSLFLFFNFGINTLNAADETVNDKTIVQENNNNESTF